MSHPFLESQLEPHPEGVQFDVGGVLAVVGEGHRGAHAPERDAGRQSEGGFILLVLNPDGEGAGDGSPGLRLSVGAGDAIGTRIGGGETAGAGGVASCVGL